MILIKNFEKSSPYPTNHDFDKKKIKNIWQIMILSWYWNFYSLWKKVLSPAFSLSFSVFFSLSHKSFVFIISPWHLSPLLYISRHLLVFHIGYFSQKPRYFCSQRHNPDFTPNDNSEAAFSATTKYKRMKMDISVSEESRKWHLQ